MVSDTKPASGTSEVATDPSQVDVNRPVPTGHTSVSTPENGREAVVSPSTGSGRLNDDVGIDPTDQMLDQGIPASMMWQLHDPCRECRLSLHDPRDRLRLDVSTEQHLAPTIRTIRIGEAEDDRLVVDRAT